MEGYKLKSSAEEIDNYINTANDWQDITDEVEVNPYMIDVTYGANKFYYNKKLNVIRCNIYCREKAAHNPENKKQNNTWCFLFPHKYKIDTRFHVYQCDFYIGDSVNFCGRQGWWISDSDRFGGQLGMTYTNNYIGQNPIGDTNKRALFTHDIYVLPIEE